ncbi:MAG: glycosyltransferase [Elusimicrobia bacterium]|nr:glycosyltransferase [Elusimicrobiota bacterium]
MKICYWGTYDSGYPRNRTIIAGLRKNGAEVTELNEPLWKSTREKLKRASAWWKNPGFLLRWLAIYFKLAFRFLREKDVDVLFVGYSGHFDMFAAKILSAAAGIPLVFDAFLSLYEAFTVDRSTLAPGGFRAKLLYCVDKYSCALADVVLLDTNAHIDYFCSTFKLPREKFRRSFIGASEDAFQPAPPGPGKKPFLVLHFGRYIPLHGLKHIVRAAKKLEAGQDILFRFIGSGEEFEPTLKLAVELGLRRTEFIRFLEPPELIKHIAEADLCLGVFGETAKAARVIPNKVYEAMAMGRPVLTGRSPAAAELLTDGEDCLLCAMADPDALAASILRLKNDDGLRLKIAENGHRLFKEKASAAALGKEIIEMLGTGENGKTFLR